MSSLSVDAGRARGNYVESRKEATFLRKGKQCRSNVTRAGRSLSLEFNEKTLPPPAFSPTTFSLSVEINNQREGKRSGREEGGAANYETAGDRESLDIN